MCKPLFVIPPTETSRWEHRKAPDKLRELIGWGMPTLKQDNLGSLLVVEDDAQLRFILRPHLQNAGFEVIEVVDGPSALRAARARRPDLVIMDIGLPGMDGIEVTRALKRDPQTEAIPIIMLTARACTDDVIRGLEAGAHDYVLKPFEVAELLARVRTVHRVTAARRDLDRLNSQLEAEVDAKSERLQLLYDFMRELNRARSRDRILDLIVGAARRMSGATRLSLLLVDAAGENLMCERAVGMDPAAVGRIKLDPAGGIGAQRSLRDNTLAAKVYGLTDQLRRAYRRDDFLSTPLVSNSLDERDAVVGVLNVSKKEDGAAFSEEEAECIRSLADAAAIALDNVVRQSQMRQSVRVLLKTVGQLAEFRDEETTRHIERVSRMARVLADEVSCEGPYTVMISEEFIDLLVQAAPMHDIGKVGIPDDILTKPGKLTDEEFQIMKTHTEIGRRVLSQALDPAHPVPLLQMCIDIAHCHHERYDGTGYPRRIAGKSIPLAARIITLVDAYDAITSERRYKPAKGHDEAVEIIISESGRHFDPVLVEAFLRCHIKFDELRATYNDVVEPVGAADWSV